MAVKKGRVERDNLEVVYEKNQWVVKFGDLKKSDGRGRPAKIQPLFKVIGEKLPGEALGKVEAALKEKKIQCSGVYMLHDSMGAVRYVGRGNIFGRLKSHFAAHEEELIYFSFYVVSDKKHEREIETLLIRGAGPLLEFNDRKKASGIKCGNVHDFEAGTCFFECHRSRRVKKTPVKRTL